MGKLSDMIIERVKDNLIDNISVQISEAVSKKVSEKIIAHFEGTSAVDSIVGKIYDRMAIDFDDLEQNVADRIYDMIDSSDLEERVMERVKDDVYLVDEISDKVVGMAEKEVDTNRIAKLTSERLCDTVDFREIENGVIDALVEELA